MSLTNDDIARRAFEIWERNGRPEGRDQEHWDQAEKELRQQTAKSTPAERTAAPAAPTPMTGSEEVYKAPGKKSRSRVTA